MSNWPLGHEFNQIQNCKEATDQNCSCFTCQVFIYEILFVFYFPQEKKNKTFGHINERHDHEPNIGTEKCDSELRLSLDCWGKPPYQNSEQIQL